MKTIYNTGLILDITADGSEEETLTDVLYIAQAGNLEPWQSDLIQAAENARLDVVVFDPDADLARQFDGVPVVVDQGGHATPEMIDAGAEAGVRLWQVLGTGLDHVDVERVHAREILLANTPGQFSAVALAEHALFLILALAKRTREADRNLRQGKMYAPLSDEVGGQTLGVVGLGASGGELARRAHALGMRTHAVDSATIPEWRRIELGVDQVAGLDGLDELLAGADYVSLHVPLDVDTWHLIDARRIALMKPTARLINVARGKLVDELALAAALARGQLAGAGIDVFGQEPPPVDHPLLSLDNAILTPHTAGVTRGTSCRRAAACIENALRVLRNEQPLYVIPPTDQ